MMVDPTAATSGCLELPIEVRKIVPIFNGRWMTAHEVHYNPKHAPHVDKIWQVANRPFANQGLVAHGATLIPIVGRTNAVTGVKEKFLLFVKEFRVPLMQYVLGFPQGLIDPNEDAEKCAMRELREETGYTAKRVLAKTSGMQPLDPGLSNSSINFLVVEVDGDAVENQNPVQQLDDGEIIEVVLLPFDDKLCDCFRQFSDQGLQIEASVYSFALGLNFNNILLS